MAADKKSIQKAKARAIDNAKRNAIPKKIGQTADDRIKAKLKGKTSDEREIRRNSSGQIVSYNIPNGGVDRPNSNTIVRNDNGKVYKYGTLKLAGVRNEYLKQEFFKSIDNDIENYTRNVGVSKTAKVIKLNGVQFSPIEGIVTEDSKSNLKFTGEIVRVGSKNTSFFYIEEGKFYSVATSKGTLWFLAEKLGLPIGMRINDEYDYGGKYKTALGEQLDYGQNQYSLYDKESYSRKSIAYVESNEYGGELTKRTILGDDIYNDVVWITWYLDKAVGGDDADSPDDDFFEQVHIIGDEATKVSWVHFLQGKNFVMSRTQIASTLNEDIYVKTVQESGQDKNDRLDIDIYRWGNAKPERLRISPTQTTEGGKTTSLYKIDGSKITTNIQKINLMYFDGYAPFGDKGTDGEYKWKVRNDLVLTASTILPKSNIGRTTITLPMRNKRGRKIICNELYRQGYLSEQMWDADERYGDMMFESDPKLVVGYQMWAKSVVKFMRENPQNTKLAYKLFKPWTEYMGYKMGVVEKPTLMGRLTNWIGTQFSYMVFDLYGGKRLLDKYNQLKVEK